MKNQGSSRVGFLSLGLCLIFVMLCPAVGIAGPPRLGLAHRGSGPPAVMLGDRDGWWDEPPDLNGSALMSEINAVYGIETEVANDFYSSSQTTILEAVWWGVYENGEGEPNVTAFNLRFYSDAGGVPGSIVAEYLESTPTWTIDVGQGPEGARVYEYHASVSADIGVGSYWFSAQACDHAIPPSWFHLAAGQVTGYQSTFRSDAYGYPDWIRIEDLIGVPFDASQRFYTTPPVPGACCFADLHCESIMPVDCSQLGGAYQGPESTCDPNPCPSLPMACCFPDGRCEQLSQAACDEGGGSSGIDTSCNPNPCARPPNDLCSGAIELTRYGSGSIAANLEGAFNDYNPTNGCTGNSAHGRDLVYMLDVVVGDIVHVVYTTPAYDGSIYILSDCGDMASCVVGADNPEPETFTWTVGATGIYYLIADATDPDAGADFTLDWSITLPESSACCFPDEHCEFVTERVCLSEGGVPLGYPSTCDPNPCPSTPMACCFPDGHCEQLPQATCAEGGGGWGGTTICDPSPCPPGGCCNPVTGNCLVVTENLCTSPSVWMGSGTACLPNPCRQPGGSSIVAWGKNDNGGCDVPAPNADFVAINGCNEHSLGLKSDGTIVAWGLNDYGQCNVPAPNADFVAIAGGGAHSLALKADGSIVAWGLNDYGQCDVPALNADFVAVAAGTSHSLGLKSNGTIVAWGNNFSGECYVPAPNTGFLAVAAGNYHSLGLKSNGTIVAWGVDWFGQCYVPAPNTGFVAVAGGQYHSLGLKSDGSIIAWGQNGVGECNVPEPNTSFIAITAGFRHSLGLKADGRIVAWGTNYYGESHVPAPNAGFVAVAGGAYRSLGLVPAVGACCNPAMGTCMVTTQGNCDYVWQGEWTTCAPNPCPQPQGACCSPTTGVCTVTTPPECVAPNVWHGEWTTCAPNPCPQPQGACCNPTTGACTMTTSLECVAPNVWHEEWATCTPNPCPQVGACCNPVAETCAMTTHAACVAPNVWHPEWTTCDPNPCPVSGIPAIAAADGEGILGVVPNPSSTSAVLWYRLSNAVPARLEIFDAAGRTIRTLDVGVVAAGTHSLAWDGRGSGGGQVAPGVYFLRLSAGEKCWRRGVIRIN